MTIEKQRTERYDPAAIEPKWLAEWERTGLHQTPDAVPGKENFYYLTMFPYPSGVLHVGHWYAFAAPDAVARHLRMRGYNVLFPMGFDAFGLPAENAAIKRKLHPAIWTEKNMAHMREQFHRMGAAIDWRREVVTCYPDYYRWNQWMF
ncbi:MAG TPA: class I tRNA ligase family protein, partial [Candidatus Limnocylindria bacterium]|nr:class I tRNA ligase family protein [Candidatus Limnocylindria bacterium]